MKWLREPGSVHSGDMSNVCRLCMAEGTECMQPIFEELEHDGERFQLSSRIIAITSLRVEPGDLLPSQACQHCVAQLNRCYDFKALCEASDDILRQRLASARSGDHGDAILLRMKEEPADALWSAQTPPSPPPLDAEDAEDAEGGTALGRVSTIFSLQQELPPSLLLFNGDSTGGGAPDAATNGLSGPAADLPFVCALCDASFPRKAQLKRHVAAHCGEPPHPCNRCDAAFSLRWELLRHLRTHNRPPPSNPFPMSSPFEPPRCQVCGLVVRDAAAFLRHVAVHPGARRLNCPNCFVECKSAVELRFHLREHARRAMSSHRPRSIFRYYRLPLRQHAPASPRPPPPSTPSVLGKAPEGEDEEEDVERNRQGPEKTAAAPVSPPTIGEATAVMSSSTILEPELEAVTGDGGSEPLVLLSTS